MRVTTSSMGAGWASDQATSFWSSLVMLSSSCTLFVTARWSSHLQEWVPGLTDGDVVSILTCLDVGAFLALPAGYCYDVLGCKFVGYMGASMTLLGYLGMFAVIQAQTQGGVWPFCLLGVLIGQGSIWLVSCALNTVAGNFPKKDRGRAVGLLMATFGLSAGIFSQLLVLTEMENPGMFLMIGGAMSSISLVSNVGITSFPESRQMLRGAARKREVSAVCLLMLALVTLPAFARPQVFGMDLWAASVALLYALILGFQVALVVRLTARHGLTVFCKSTLQPLWMSTPMTSSVPELAEGMPFRLVLSMPEYWLLACVFLVAVGVGQTVSNSIADFNGVDTTTGVAVFAAGNTLGRIAPGYLSDILLRVCDRASFLVAATVVLIASQLVLLFSQDKVWLDCVGIFLASLAFGSFWVLVPAAEAEWFGRRHFGKIHGLMTLMGGVGGVLLIYQGTRLVAEAELGPCEAWQRSLGCFRLERRMSTVLSCMAFLAAVAMKLTRRHRSALINSSS